MDRYEMAIGLIVIAIGSFIAGAACVGIQLEKVKRQRDEARKQLQQAYDSGFDQGYMLGKKNWRNKMKKFEEELFSEVPCKFGLSTEGEYKQSILVKHFGDWVSPEDHQFKVGEVQDDLSCANEEIERLNAKLEKQQPEIPEVPQFVAEYIERCKRSDCGLIWAVRPDRDANENSEKIYDWLYPNGVRLSDGTFPEPFEPDNLVRPDKENHIKFVRAWLDGYTVKEKRFYLKHKSVLIFDPDSDDSDVEELYLGAGGNFVPYKHLAKIFTQQEIDSMETGSYEQIEVEK